jgi:hypothetical protein
MGEIPLLDLASHDTLSRAAGAHESAIPVEHRKLRLRPAKPDAYDSIFRLDRLITSAQ